MTPHTPPIRTPQAQKDRGRLEAVVSRLGKPLITPLLNSTRTGSKKDNSSNYYPSGITDSRGGRPLFPRGVRMGGVWGCIFPKFYYRLPILPDLTTFRLIAMNGTNGSPSQRTWRTHFTLRKQRMTRKSRWLDDILLGVNAEVSPRVGSGSPTSPGARFPSQVLRFARKPSDRVSGVVCLGICLARAGGAIRLTAPHGGV
jgi:hypothetical protein